VTEHTPGPWRWQFVGTVGQWMVLDEHGNGLRIGGPPRDDLTADQRLIAAAPDLLEAAEKAIVAWSYGNTSTTQAMWALTEAIAKARGEAVQA
jgi:hypothetical protein